MEIKVIEWKPAQGDLGLISHKTDMLIDQFPSYIAKFDKIIEDNREFDGPPLYFHHACICNFARAPIVAKLADNRFYEYLYAALATWGMHRLGNSPTKLCNFAKFKSEISGQYETLAQLEGFKLWSLTEQEQVKVQGVLASVLDAVKVNKAEVLLVVNSKILHHVLPDLVPPIDWRYTLHYFGLSNKVPSQPRAGSIFVHLFPSFVRVSNTLATTIQSTIDLSGTSWHTSFTKVIDNAIIGALYVR